MVRRKNKGLWEKVNEQIIYKNIDKQLSGFRSIYGKPTPKTFSYNDAVTGDMHAGVRPKDTYITVKRIADFVLAVIAIIVLLPVLLLISVFIFAEDFGPPIYVSQRIGQGGRPFKMYKFRSMRRNADTLESFLTENEIERYKTEYKLDNDPRVTRVGRAIRKTSIDELPQLVNIIKGDLSIIGPRPVLQDETELYGLYRQRLLSIKPGLTGYWQAYARSNAGYGDGKRQAMELYYVENISLGLDIKVFFKTIATVVLRTGAK